MKCGKLGYALKAFEPLDRTLFSKDQPTPGTGKQPVNAMTPIS
jgi:hypothetical protein